MEVAIAFGIAFGAYLAWICFLSWLVSRVAYKESRPDRRAAQTAATAFALAIMSNLATIFLIADPLPFLPTDRTWALLGLLLYVPAALIDYLMLRSAFRKGWVEDAEPFL